jgi:hypothetical protein
MPWRIALALVALLVACGLTWPGPPWPDEYGGSCEGTDYSQLDACKGCWGRFTNSQVASAEEDHCAADGDDTLTWQAAVVADAGDVPTGSPAGADSTLHDGTINSIGTGIVTGYTADSLTVGGWWKQSSAALALMMRRGAGTGAGGTGDWDLRCDAGDDVYALMSGTEQTAAGTGPSCSAATWSFSAFSYDGDDTDEIQTFSSESAGNRTLLDCDGSGQSACQTEAIGPKEIATTVAFGSNAAGASRFTGNAYEMWLCETVLTPAQLCEICRCGFYGDNASDRKAACNNCSMGTGAPAVWPALGWPGT